MHTSIVNVTNDAHEADYPIFFNPPFLFSVVLVFRVYPTVAVYKIPGLASGHRHNGLCLWALSLNCANIFTVISEYKSYLRMIFLHFCVLIHLLMFAPLRHTIGVRSGVGAVQF